MKSILTLLVLLFFGNLYSQSDINQAEYFFDNDPGFGSANAITVSASNTFTLANYNIATQNLAEGIHFLYIRCKDTNNKWSLPVRKVMYIHPNLNATSPITTAEYYFDTDPGFGSANAITVSAGNTFTLANYNIATQNLAEGIHFLYIRCKDSNNKWSLPMRKVMYIHPNLIATSPIASAEYYFDTDPGFGSANAITVSAGNSLMLTNYNIATQNLPEGIHFLYIRCKDSNNKWSLPMRKVMYIHPNLIATSPITNAEYFVDTDPGVGLANAISVTAGTTVNQSFDVTTNGLAIGNHILFVRVKNQDGVWSVISKKAFTLTSPLSVSENMHFEARVFPNPTTGIISISNQDNLAIDKIEIVDILGKIVSVKTDNTSQIDISEFPNGVYIFKIHSGGTVFQKKIIKQ